MSVCMLKLKLKLKGAEAIYMYRLPTAVDAVANVRPFVWCNVNVNIGLTFVG